MVKASDLTDSWNTIKEVDLRPLVQQALNGVRIALVGRPGSGRKTLAEQMRQDPARPASLSDAPVLVLDLETAPNDLEADLIILLVDDRQADVSLEQEAALGWTNAGGRVLVFINQFEQPEEQRLPVAWTDWRRRRVVKGSALDDDFLVKKFAPAVIDLLPERLLGLGRYFPLFRLPVAHHLINDTCLSNAGYSLSTGLAEIVPVFDIPLNVADMVVLTKTQAYLVFKLGLALGFSTRWQDYVAEFGSVLGSGFLWRQMARSLVGLIPVWGIVPKVAVAYSGTYVVGNVILQWYLTGRHISPRQMSELSRQAFAKGKSVAQNLLKKAPRPRLPKLQRPRLPGLPKPRLPRLPARKPKQLPPPQVIQVCPACGKANAEDASFCQYCGKSLKVEE
ncbi:MAG: zinc-ribbon domain-containing protein [Chloroflexota bacterium]